MTNGNEEDVTSQPSTLIIKVNPSLESEDETNLYSEELEKITYNLRTELSELNIIEKVDLVTEGQAPEGTRSGDVVAWGSLLVTLASAGSTVLPSLVNVIQSWSKRNDNKRITLQIGGDSSLTR